MAETIIMPGRPRTPSRGRFVPPLLILPLVVYNLVAFLVFAADPAGWSTGLFAVAMPSGAAWTIGAGDLMLAGGVVLLFLEIIKSTAIGRHSVLEHMISMLVFVVFLVEFILVGAAASSTFFLLMVMSLIDVVAGFTVSITGAQRDVAMS